MHAYSSDRNRFNAAISAPCSMDESCWYTTANIRPYAFDDQEVHPHYSNDVKTQGGERVIGAGATILPPGVSIGRDAVVATGAVVADDVPPASLVTGSKAVVRRQW